jgi:hypothetical protein
MGPIGVVNSSCMPSKALQHAAKYARDVRNTDSSFASPAIDVDKLHGCRDGVGKVVSLNQLEFIRQEWHRTQLRARDHCRRLRTGNLTVHPAQRPAGDRQHRHARIFRHSEAPAGARRPSVTDPRSSGHMTDNEAKAKGKSTHQIAKEMGARRRNRFAQLRLPGLSDEYGAAIELSRLERRTSDS